MSFNQSVENIRVDDNHILRADKDGQTFELDLDTVLGNDNGRFVWGGRDFSQSAENVSFSVEGGGNVPVLRAKLGGGEGADVNLAERIAFEDNKLVFN